MVKVKVKLSLLQAYVAQRVGRGIALLFLDRGTRRGWVVSSTPRPHFALGKDPVPILQEAGWAPGPVWKGGKSRPQWDSIPDRPARSQSLYRLSYPAHDNNMVCAQIYKVGATIPSLSVGLQNFMWREITGEYGRYSCGCKFILECKRTKGSEYAVAMLVEALSYKPEGRGFDSRWGHWIFHWLNFPAALWPWNRLNFWRKWVLWIRPGSKGGRCVGVTTFLPLCAGCPEILGASKS